MSSPFGLLGFDKLRNLPPAIARPPFDPRTLRVGIVHLGLGAFHRAHQANYTEDAIIEAGGDWGILGVSLRHATAPEALAPQDCLYTLETLDTACSHRVIGVLRSAIAASSEPHLVLQAIASPQVHIVTLTVTEKGYALTPQGALDFEHPDIARDLRGPAAPSSTIGWLVAGFAARRLRGGAGLTVISCDNVMRNGERVRRAVLDFAAINDRDLSGWIEDNVCFPNSMVDSITPASDLALQARVAEAIGCRDLGCVQREPFRQWVMEDRFGGPRPAWDAAGVQLVSDAVPFQELKLHVLNTANSALAYLGIAKGHVYAHEAFADPAIFAFVDGLIGEEMTAAFAGLPVADYWSSIRARLSNPRVRHRLRQIGEDGSKKLSQRIYGPLQQNLRKDLPWRRMAALFGVWLSVASRGLVDDPCGDDLKAWARAGAKLDALFDYPSLLPQDFRGDARVREALALAANDFPYTKDVLHAN